MPMNNRNRFITSEPEFDISQFKKKILDIPYGTQSKNQILDIYYPEQGQAPYPTVILFHGGAFEAGHKRTHYIESMLEPVFHGYVVVSVEYRLYPEALWPAQYEDGRSAILYLKKHAKELELDTNRFAVWGNSAGGSISQRIATNQDKDIQVQCAIAWYTVEDFISNEQFTINTQNIRDIDPNESPLTKVLGYNPMVYPDKACKESPISYVNENTAPMLLQHGTKDMLVDYHQSIYMAHRVNAICPGRATLDLFEGEPHGSSVIKGKENRKRCIEFLDKYLQK